MRIIGCDLHARQQTIAMLDTTTREVVNVTLTHEGNNVREFYSELPRPVRVGIEATGSMQWFASGLSASAKTADVYSILGPISRIPSSEKALVAAGPNSRTDLRITSYRESKRRQRLRETHQSGRVFGGG